MNPKNVNDLDPKLKAAYDRIMGTTFNPQSQNQPTPQNTQVAQPVTSTPTTPPPSPVTQPEEPASQNPPIMQTQVYTPGNPQPEPEPSKPNAEQQAPATNSSVFTSSPSSSPQMQKKKLNVLPMLLIIGGLIFFAVYIVVWAKVFGLF
jgi:hypothetical protein